MTDEEVMVIYTDITKDYGELVPNYVHHPRQFEYFLKLYRLKQELKKYTPQN